MKYPLSFFLIFLLFFGCTTDTSQEANLDADGAKKEIPAQPPSLPSENETEQNNTITDSNISDESVPPLLPTNETNNETNAETIEPDEPEIPANTTDTEEPPPNINETNSTVLLPPANETLTPQTNLTQVNETTDAPVSNETESPGYSWHYEIYATFFWIGEAPSGDNAGIGNDVSAWDEDWVTHYGGYDDPDCRVGYYPCNITPTENPFYFALPYNDFTDDGDRRESALRIPWYMPTSLDISLMKNRWVEIKYAGKSCYTQMEDVGPFNSNDFDYVFGNASSDHEVGIDLSPAMKTCLGMPDNDYVDWRFVDYEDVTDGPWKEIVTTSQTNWH